MGGKNQHEQTHPLDQDLYEKTIISSLSLLNIHSLYLRLEFYDSALRLLRQRRLKDLDCEGLDNWRGVDIRNQNESPVPRTSHLVCRTNTTAFDLVSPAVRSEQTFHPTSYDRYLLNSDYCLEGNDDSTRELRDTLDNTPVKPWLDIYIHSQ